jgi:hypothetical protein
MDQNHHDAMDGEALSRQSVTFADRLFTIFRMVTTIVLHHKSIWHCIVCLSGPFSPWVRKRVGLGTHLRLRALSGNGRDRNIAKRIHAEDPSQGVRLYHETPLNYFMLVPGGISYTP